MKRITIIGGGASGTLTAVNLLRNNADTESHINLIERQSRVGRGVAFGTRQDTHLLNVPAARMGAFPDKADDFHNWLTENGHHHDGHDFVARKLFGDYLRHVFNRAVEDSNNNSTIEIIDDEAVDLSVDNDGAQVILRSGEIVLTDKVVLAFGNSLPPHPSVRDTSFTESTKYYRDPWRSRMYESIGESESIFIVGTGLSMVDVALHFNESGHLGKIYAISTRGMLPAIHKLGFTYPSFYEEIVGIRRITDILKVVRRHAEIAETVGSNWRAVIDALRPDTQKIWCDLPLKERRIFKQHLSRYWNTARHRMPPSAAATITEMRANGNLEILSGRLLDISSNDRFGIKFQSGQTTNYVEADNLVNCIGSESNYSRLESDFVQNLVRRGHIRNDELAMGIAASTDGRIIDKNGNLSNVVFTLGTALKGTLWETTAIPEIRTQARDLALRLLE